ncbi:hypothetical protein F5148DRAFT_1211716, partial [Russula earlei]
MAPFSGLPAFGSAGGSAAKAVPTVAFTALDEPDADALGPVVTTAPLPADAVGEAMAILLARPWTTSFHVASSSSPLVHCDNRRAQLLRFPSLANWGTSFSCRRKIISESASTPLPEQATAKKVVASAGQTTDEERILQSSWKMRLGFEHAS